METLQTLLFVLQVLVAVSLIGFILIQHGKGADAGAAFGSGASSTVFGASGSSNFLSKTTAVLAVIFLANSLALGYIATEQVKEASSLLEQQSVTNTVPDQVREEFLIPTESPSDIPLVPETSGSDVPDLPVE